MMGLEPGQHGIHVHENGDCAGPTAEGAGDHLNPDGAKHGAPSDEPATRHAGDLGNIMADASGEADLTLTVDGLTVEGERGVASKAIIVHAGEDDFSTQPSGESGDPVACGVIEVSARG
jgi:superoxide dismutase, Cu-Zn family